jgi:hypothetical protein
MAHYLDPDPAIRGCGGVTRRSDPLVVSLLTLDIVVSEESGLQVDSKQCAYLAALACAILVNCLN